MLAGARAGVTKSRKGLAKLAQELAVSEVRIPIQLFLYRIIHPSTYSFVRSSAVWERQERSGAEENVVDEEKIEETIEELKRDALPKTWEKVNG